MGELSAALLSGGFAAKTAVLDTALLAVQLTALTDYNLFRSFKRVGAYTFEDAVLITWLLDQFHKVVTTAYVLAEVSNLGNALSGFHRDAWFAKLAGYALLTEELHVPTGELGSRSQTLRFGIADSALSRLAEDCVLITADFRLAGFISSDGGQVLNYEQIKAVAAQLSGRSGNKRG